MYEYLLVKMYVAVVCLLQLQLERGMLLPGCFAVVGTGTTCRHEELKCCCQALTLRPQASGIRHQAAISADKRT